MVGKRVVVADGHVVVSHHLGLFVFSSGLAMEKGRYREGQSKDRVY